jgi:hypothetical protein
MNGFLNTDITVTDNPLEYQTFLRSRPPKMEVAAIQLIIQLCSKYRYTFSYITRSGPF